MSEGIEDPARLAAHAQRIRDSKILGKSFQINRLFDYLVQQSMAGVSPKEIEIAQSVFDKSTDLHAGSDASVRVCAHRLRKKLDELSADEKGERLALPRGEYRLVVVPPGKEVPSVEPAPAPGHERRRSLWGGAALALAVTILGLFWFFSIHSRDPRLHSILWRGIAASNAPALIVSGDQYVFGELGSDGTIVRTISDPAIRGRADLDRYKMQGAQDALKYVDMNAHSLPEGLAPALSLVATIMAETRNSDPPVQSITMSRFTNDMLANHDVVYLGLLNSLGDLRDALFGGSGFALSPDASALADRTTGRSYISDWADPSETGIMRRDFAYIARVPGPSGNQVLVIAGTKDPGLVEAAQIASDPQQLKLLAQRLGNAPAFEALYEVRTFGPSNFSGKLLIARPLNVDRLWPAAILQPAANRKSTQK